MTLRFRFPVLDAVCCPALDAMPPAMRYACVTHGFCYAPYNYRYHYRLEELLSKGRQGLCRAYKEGSV